ncbi:UPF0175 family protein [Candidatus Acetothermia bacterium]|nr:UPF0175 family protein [Candidatus Acetothermia bacterium]
MALKKVEIEFPEDIWERVGVSPQKVTAKAREFIVMALLRQGEISQGRAAELLGVDRWALMDLMGKYQVPATQLTAEELVAEQKRLHQYRKSGA